MPASTTPKAPVSIQKPLVFNTAQHIRLMVHGIKPYYTTNYGAAYLSDSRELLRKIPESSIDLFFTSPPYALHFKKEYGNVEKEDYVEWFLTFAREIFRALKDDGSFVLNMGEVITKGSRQDPYIISNS